MRKIALIGHSASGKTSTLLELGIDPSAGDMDPVFGIDAPPCVEETLDWIVDPSTPGVVGMSNHLALLWHLRERRRRVPRHRAFDEIRWVYLRKSRRLLMKHLNLPVFGSWRRPDPVKATVLSQYGRFSKHFNALADHVIECDDISVAGVACQIRQLAEEDGAREEETA